MPKYYTYEKVSGIANQEKLGEGLTSTSEEPKRIVALWVTEVTTPLQHDAYIRGYIEREKILEIPYTQFLVNKASDNRQILPARIEVDHEIPVGQKFVAGHLSGATASDFEYVYEYEII